MKRSTGIVLVIFLALVGLLFYLNQKEPPAEE
jgi:preprotein translocase subunit SecG